MANRKMTCMIDDRKQEEYRKYVADMYGYNNLDLRYVMPNDLVQNAPSKYDLTKNWKNSGDVKKWHQRRYFKIYPHKTSFNKTQSAMDRKNTKTERCLGTGDTVQNTDNTVPRKTKFEEKKAATRSILEKIVKTKFTTITQRRSKMTRPQAHKTYSKEIQSDISEEVRPLKKDLFKKKLKIFKLIKSNTLKRTKEEEFRYERVQKKDILNCINTFQAQEALHQEVSTLNIMSSTEITEDISQTLTACDSKNDSTNSKTSTIKLCQSILDKGEKKLNNVIHCDVSSHRLSKVDIKCPKVENVNNTIEILKEYATEDLPSCSKTLQSIDYPNISKNNDNLDLVNCKAKTKSIFNWVENNYIENDNSERKCVKEDLKKKGDKEKEKRNKRSSLFRRKKNNLQINNQPLNLKESVETQCEIEKDTIQIISKRSTVTNDVATQSQQDIQNTTWLVNDTITTNPKTYTNLDSPSTSDTTIVKPKLDEGTNEGFSISNHSIESNTESICDRINVKVKWNNQTYAPSNSSIFEFMQSVFNSAEVLVQSRSNICTPSDDIYNQYFHRDVTFVQNFQTWMIPHTVTDRENPLVNQDENHKRCQKCIDKIDELLRTNNFLRLHKSKGNSELNYELLKGFLSDSKSENQQFNSSEEKVFEVIEYDPSNDFKKLKINEISQSRPIKRQDERIFKQTKDVSKKVVKQTRDLYKRNDNLDVPNKSNKCDVIGVGIITRRDTKVPTHPVFKITEYFSDEDSDHSVQVVKKRDLTKGYLQNFCKDYIDFDLFSWSVSDSRLHINTSNESQWSLVANTNSCPNILDDYVAMVSSCVGILSGTQIPKTVGSKNGAKHRRTIEPKDSLQVFKKRRLYRAKLKNKLNIYSTSSNLSKGIRNKQKPNLYINTNYSFYSKEKLNDSKKIRNLRKDRSFSGFRGKKTDITTPRTGSLDSKKDGSPGSRKRTRLASKSEIIQSFSLSNEESKTYDVPDVKIKIFPPLKNVHSKNKNIKIFPKTSRLREMPSSNEKPADLLPFKHQPKSNSPKSFKDSISLSNIKQPVLVNESQQFTEFSKPSLRTVHESSLLENSTHSELIQAILPKQSYYDEIDSLTELDSTTKKAQTSDIVKQFSQNGQINFRLKRGSLDAEEQLTHTFKITDENGRTIVEREDYGDTIYSSIAPSNGRTNSFPNDVDNALPITVNKMASIQKETDSEKIRSEASVANVVEINFKIKVLHGDKTQIDIGEWKNNKFVNDNIVDVSPIIEGHNETCIDNDINIAGIDAKESVNIRIVIRNFKNKLKHSNSKAAQKNIKNFSEHIFNKFQTVSTGHSLTFNRFDTNKSHNKMSTDDFESGLQKHISDVSITEVSDVPDEFSAEIKSHRMSEVSTHTKDTNVEDSPVTNKYQSNSDSKLAHTYSDNTCITVSDTDLTSHNAGSTQELMMVEARSLTDYNTSNDLITDSDEPVEFTERIVEARRPDPIKFKHIYFPRKSMNKNRIEKFKKTLMNILRSENEPQGSKIASEGVSSLPSRKESECSEYEETFSAEKRGRQGIIYDEHVQATYYKLTKENKKDSCYGAPRKADKKLVRRKDIKTSIRKQPALTDNLYKDSEFKKPRNKLTNTIYIGRVNDQQSSREFPIIVSYTRSSLGDNRISKTSTHVSYDKYGQRYIVVNRQFPKETHRLKSSLFSDCVRSLYKLEMDGKPTKTVVFRNIYKAASSHSDSIRAKDNYSSVTSVSDVYKKKLKLLDVNGICNDKNTYCNFDALEKQTDSVKDCKEFNNYKIGLQCKGDRENSVMITNLSKRAVSLLKLYPCPHHLKVKNEKIESLDKKITRRMKGETLLQLYETKKAVLEIYSDTKDTGDIVDKLPKFMYNREGDIYKNCEQNSKKSKDVVMMCFE